MNKPSLILLLALTVPHYTLQATTNHEFDNGVEFVVGNDLWQPGKRYRNGTDWLALACTSKGCNLEPANLSVRPQSWQGHYDDKPTQGQKLRFTPTVKVNSKVIAWFHQSEKYSWLVPGNVITYASTATRFKRPSTEGTLEVAVDLPDGSSSKFVPLFDKAGGVFHLQLRTPDRRQMLGQLGNCSKVVTTDYLIWAGDLDRDGQPDYLVSFVDSDGQVVLYLSSAAGAKKIVGTAGIFDAPPSGGECDGSGWLPQ